MSQHDFDIATADANTGLTFRAAVNAALKSLASLSSGASAPTTPYAYQLWADTTTGLLRIRNAQNTDWITIGALGSAFLGLVSLVDPQTITAAHTLNPGSPRAPFALGPNAQGQLVSGLNADQLGGFRASDIFDRKNWIVNGDCRVAQRPSAFALVNGAYGFGMVDRFAGKATGTAVMAGMLSSGLVGGISIPTTCLQFSNVMITGAGTLSLRYRMEGSDAACLTNRNVSFSFMTVHDFGAATNHTIYFRTPRTTQNDFNDPIAICNSGAISVPSGTRVKYENVALGECKTGLEIEIMIECGAISTKNWYGSEFQLELGPRATDFEYIPYQDQLRRCQRYLFMRRALTASAIPFGYGQSFGPTAVGFGMEYPVPMAKIPTVLYSDVSHFRVQTGGNTAIPTVIRYWQVGEDSTNYKTPWSCLLEVSNPGWTFVTGVPFSFFANASSAAWLTFDAEL